MSMVRQDQQPCHRIGLGFVDYLVELLHFRAGHPEMAGARRRAGRKLQRAELAARSGRDVYPVWQAAKYLVSIAGALIFCLLW